MAQNVDIPELLSNKVDADFAKRLASLPLKSILTGSKIADAFLTQLPFTQPLFVADEHTLAASGLNVPAIILSTPVTPTQENVEAVKAAITHHNGVVAIGSGTINDICKRAAFECNVPYAVFATALSMNGYASANASISVNNKKDTLPARMPTMICVDDDVVKNAPSDMLKAGFGDAMCRFTAEADWKLSHQKHGTPFDGALFEMLYPSELRLIKAAEQGTIDSVALAENLILSGIGMTLARSSHPASQGEHAIAHAMEHQSHTTALHGAQIAVTTLTMAQLQDTHQRVDPLGLNHAKLKALFQKTHMPTTPSDVGWDEETYKSVVKEAHKWRNRYGYLHLDAGL